MLEMVMDNYITIKRAKRHAKEACFIGFAMGVSCGVAISIVWYLVT